MDWFYNNTINKINKTKIKNSIGQWIDSYSLGDLIKCDVQPAGNEVARKTFGEDIECNYIVYCEETLKEGDYIYYKNRSYQIKKLIDWDYSIAAILGVDIVVS